MGSNEAGKVRRSRKVQSRKSDHLSMLDVEDPPHPPKRSSVASHGSNGSQATHKTGTVSQASSETVVASMLTKMNLPSQRKKSRNSRPEPKCSSKCTYLLLAAMCIFVAFYGGNTYLNTMVINDEFDTVASSSQSKNSDVERHQEKSKKDDEPDGDSLEGKIGESADVAGTKAKPKAKDEVTDSLWDGLLATTLVTEGDNSTNKKEDEYPEQYDDSQTPSESKRVVPGGEIITSNLTESTGKKGYKEDSNYEVTESAMNVTEKGAGRTMISGDQAEVENTKPAKEDDSDELSRDDRRYGDNKIMSQERSGNMILSNDKQVINLRDDEDPQLIVHEGMNPKPRTNEKQKSASVAQDVTYQVNSGINLSQENSDAQALNQNQKLQETTMEERGNREGQMRNPDSRGDMKQTGFGDGQMRIEAYQGMEKQERTSDGRNKNLEDQGMIQEQGDGAGQLRISEIRGELTDRGFGDMQMRNEDGKGMILSKRNEDDQNRNGEGEGMIQEHRDSNAQARSAGSQAGIRMSNGKSMMEQTEDNTNSTWNGKVQGTKQEQGYGDGQMRDPNDPGRQEQAGFVTDKNRNEVDQGIVQLKASDNGQERSQHGQRTIVHERRDGDGQMRHPGSQGALLQQGLGDGRMRTDDSQAMTQGEGGTGQTKTQASQELAMQRKDRGGDVQLNDQNVGGSVQDQGFGDSKIRTSDNQDMWRETRVNDGQMKSLEGKGMVQEEGNTFGELEIPGSHGLGDSRIQVEDGDITMQQKAGGNDPYMNRDRQTTILENEDFVDQKLDQDSQVMMQRSTFKNARNEMINEVGDTESASPGDKSKQLLSQGDQDKGMEDERVPQGSNKLNEIEIEAVDMKHPGDQMMRQHEGQGLIITQSSKKQGGNVTASGQRQDMVYQDRNDVMNSNNEKDEYTSGISNEMMNQNGMQQHDASMIGFVPQSGESTQSDIISQVDEVVIQEKNLFDDEEEGHRGIQNQSQQGMRPADSIIGGHQAIIHEGSMVNGTSSLTSRESMSKIPFMGAQLQRSDMISNLNTGRDQKIVSQVNFMVEKGVAESDGTREPTNQFLQIDNQSHNRGSNRRLLMQHQSPIPPALDSRIEEYVRNHVLFERLVNVDQDLPFEESHQIPYFWHIHKSAGSTLKHIMVCLDRVQTRRMNLPECNEDENSIHTCKLEWGTVVNVDASSPGGIARINKLGLLKEKIPNLVIDTSRVFEALSILSKERRGRLFVVMRDPVERAISKFYYTKIATWERNWRPDVVNMTMIEFADSRYCYDNWITRRLVHKMAPGSELTLEDLAIAKEILRQKALILLTNDMIQSSDRIVKYFGWSTSEYQQWCINKFAVEEPINSNPHPTQDRNSAEWHAIRQKNIFDVALYDYGLQLFEAQGRLIDQMSSNVPIRKAISSYFPSNHHNIPQQEQQVPTEGMYSPMLPKMGQGKLAYQFEAERHHGQ